MNKSPKKAKIYFTIAQILFWFSFICGITPNLRHEISLFNWVSEFSGTMVWNPLIYISFVLFWRSAKNLTPEELTKRKFWSKYFPKPVVVLFVLGVVMLLLLIATPFLFCKR